jgi:inhibitor of cysteine peptidase
LGLLVVDGSRAGAQPVASIALPSPRGVLQLYPGCNNLALSFPDGTASATVVEAVTPVGTVESMWRYDTALRRFEGFSPESPAVSDLLTVNLWDAVWLCVSAPSSLKLTEADNGSTVELALGDTMEVVLDGNPTTGFTWESVAPDTAVLQQVGEPEFVAETELLGSGGKFTFRFQAVGSGQTVLQLIYHRPWETDVAPERTFEVTVIVS